MNSHEVRGIAAMTISRFLEYCEQSGITDELLKKYYAVADADQIKKEMRHIAEELQASADYHKDMRDALKGGEV